MQWRSIKCLLLTKSLEYDGISSNTMRSVSEEIFEVLKRLLNLSINQVAFPENMKITCAAPIFQTRDDYLRTNYRPFSVFPCFSKILKHVMYSRVYDFLTEGKSSHSTEHSILQLSNQISNYFNKNQFTLGFFIDFPKAFEMVDQKILIKKLGKYGIKRQYIDLFRSYLNSWKHYVRYSKEPHVQKKLNVVSLRVQSCVHYFFWYLLMKFLDPIMFSDETNSFYSKSNINELLGKEDK